jgi:DnaJ homolog subfamily C member 1
VFLIILTSGLQYLVQRINYKRDLGRIESIVSKAKAAAWGPKMIPINGKRKV